MKFTVYVEVVKDLSFDVEAKDAEEAKQIVGRYIDPGFAGEQPEPLVLGTYNVVHSVEEAD